jgi:hypothetical protein
MAGSHGTMPGVTLVAHADWSVSDQKRWVARASRGVNGRFEAAAPVQEKSAGTLLQRLRTEAGEGGCALVGFDFPIGLPAAYARKARIGDFQEFLLNWGDGCWADFDKPARLPEEVCLERPFYPLAPGGSQRSFLTSGLGISWKGLYRRCELAHNGRRAACPLFWTLGGQQVGKAALSGWREVLVPGLRQADVGLAIWPFAGRINMLLTPGSVTVAETYPAEFYAPLGFSSGRWSKRRQSDRQARSGALCSWAERNSIELADDLRKAILDGFGVSTTGEDQFDAVTGLFGILNTLYNGIDEPEEVENRTVEGWILGQAWS